MVLGQDDDEWDKRSIRSIRSSISQANPTTNANIESSLPDYEDNSPKSIDRKDKDKEAINRFWYNRP